MHVTLVALLGLALTVAQTQEPLIFKNGLRQSVMHGDKSDRRDVAVTLTGEAMVVTPKSGTPITIAFSTMSGIVYDRRPVVRKMAYTAGKATDHFLTVQYKFPNGTGDFAELEMEKDVAPKLVAALEARSGKKIERTGGS